MGPNLIIYRIKIIREELSDDSIIFGDDGSHTFYGIKYFEIRKAGTFFFDDVFGAMGHAIGYSIGAQLVNLNSKIVCLTGDGCTMMQGTEISTAVNYNIPVTVIVLNNGRLDMVDKSMKNVLGRSVGAIYNTPLDVKGFAESMGAIAFKCYNEIELRNALKNNQTRNKPVVIEVIVDPDEIPPTMRRGS
jgi:acetolactate synthase-1/2/3 large subunit